MELVKTEKELNAKQKKFCQEYLYGEHQGNGTKCYRKVYSVVGNVLSDASACSCASDLLKDPRVIAYLRVLSEKAAEKLDHKLKRWEDLAPEAQQTLVECMRGTCRSRMRFEASLIVLDRALGKVATKTELELYLDSDGVSAALHALVSRTRLLTDGR